MSYFKHLLGLAFLLSVLGLSAPASAQSTVNVLALPSVDALRAGNWASVNYVNVPSYHGLPDRYGGGIFAYQTGTCTDDGGTIVEDTGGHCFYRQMTGPVTVEMFGAYGNYVPGGSTGTNDQPAIAAAITYLESSAVQGGTLTFSRAGAWYRMDSGVTVDVCAYSRAQGITIDIGNNNLVDMQTSSTSVLWDFPTNYSCASAALAKHVTFRSSGGEITTLIGSSTTTQGAIRFTDYNAGVVQGPLNIQGYQNGNGVLIYVSTSDGSHQSENMFIEQLDCGAGDQYSGNARCVLATDPTSSANSSIDTLTINELKCFSIYTNGQCINLNGNLARMKLDHVGGFIGAGGVTGNRMFVLNGPMPGAELNVAWCDNCDPGETSPGQFITIGPNTPSPVTGAYALNIKASGYGGGGSVQIDHNVWPYAKFDGYGVPYLPADGSGAGLTFTGISSWGQINGKTMCDFAQLTYPTTSDGNGAAVTLPSSVVNLAYAGTAAPVMLSTSLTFPVVGVVIGNTGKMATDEL